LQYCSAPILLFGSVGKNLTNFSKGMIIPLALPPHVAHLIASRLWSPTGAKSIDSVMPLCLEKSGK
jgi:hypothetical protein